MTGPLSPRAWGGTDRWGEFLWRDWVVPTRVGVNRTWATAHRMHRGCPHARGGEPSDWAGGGGATELSPRAWG